MHARVQDTSAPNVEFSPNSARDGSHSREDSEPERYVPASSDYNRLLVRRSVVTIEESVGIEAAKIPPRATPLKNVHVHDGGVVASVNSIPAEVPTRVTRTRYEALRALRWSG